MASGINVGGVWKDIDSSSVRVSGTWRTVNSIHAKVGGVWEEVWPTYTPLSVTIDPNSSSGAVANNTGPYSVAFDAIVTGGNGSHTYSWSVTGDLTLTSGQGTSSVLVEIPDGADVIRSGTLSVTVDDGVSSDSHTTGSISRTYGSPV